MEKYHDNKLFDKIIYRNTIVKEREFIHCKFVNCNFSDTSFEDCIFENCRFEFCDLTSLKVTYSRFIDVTFAECKMIGIVWDEASQPFSIACEESNISYSSFYGMKLKKTSFLKCVAHEVNFSEADLESSRFNYTDLTDSIFQNSNLTKANFENATNYNGIDLRNKNIRKAVFSMPEAFILLRNFDIILK